METRTVKQIKVFKLILNRISGGESDVGFLVAISFSKEDLLNWYKSQMAEKKYRGSHPDAIKKIEEHNSKEGAFKKKIFQSHKTFKIGSPLEWYSPLLNPMRVITEKELKYYGLYEVWMTQEEFYHEFNYLITSIEKKVFEVGGNYLGDVVEYRSTRIPVPQVIGITPNFLKVIEETMFNIKK